MNNYRFVLMEWFMDDMKTSDLVIRALNEKEAKAEAKAVASNKRSTFNNTHIHFVGKDTHHE